MSDQGFTAELVAQAGDLTALFAEARDAAASAASAEGHDSGLVDTRVLPPGYKIHQQVLEGYDARPSRPRGDAHLLTTDALQAHLVRHVNAATVAYVLPQGHGAPRIVAIYNDHDGGDAGWRDHRATLTYHPTPGWARWTKAHRQMMGQVEFAELVEDGLGEIGEPPGADLLDLVQSIHATTSAAFRSTYRLKDGQTQVSYVEDVNATAGKDGTLSVPASITLVVAPFIGAEPRIVKARLRIRVTGGKLALGVILDNPEQVVADALDVEVARLRSHDALDGVPFLTAHNAPSPVEALS